MISFKNSVMKNARECGLTDSMILRAGTIAGFLEDILKKSANPNYDKIEMVLVALTPHPDKSGRGFFLMVYIGYEIN